jgi:predicted enzyme related to lactoylglutathione lyase
VGEIMAKGFAGSIFLNTDDVHAAYEDLTSRGLEFVEKPHEVPYGIDSSFRDPSGNHFRLAQLREAAVT